MTICCAFHKGVRASHPNDAAIAYAANEVVGEGDRAIPVCNAGSIRALRILDMASGRKKRNKKRLFRLSSGISTERSGISDRIMGSEGMPTMTTYKICPTREAIAARTAPSTVKIELPSKSVNAMPSTYIKAPVPIGPAFL